MFSRKSDTPSPAPIPEPNGVTIRLSEAAFLKVLFALLGLGMLGFGAGATTERPTQPEAFPTSNAIHITHSEF